MMLRLDALRAIYPRLTAPDTVVVTIMGAVAAELQSVGHRPGFFYLQHAMGLASSMGLGIALARPKLQVIVLDGDGSILMSPNLDSYLSLFRKDFLMVAWRTLWVALVSTAITILMALPCGYAMARSKRKTLFLILVIIPFWTNFIIRIFSWRIFLSTNGVLNEALLTLGLISSPLEIIRTDWAVIIVMVYVYLPYMILPLYSVIEKLDFTLLDAAMDLGANERRAFFRITLPLCREGIFAGSII